MKIKLLGEVKVIAENKYSKHNYFAWPSIARLQNGKIAVVCSGFRTGHVCPFGKTVILYSEDEGETFSLPAPVIDTVLDDGGTGICTFGKSGVIVTSCAHSVKFEKSVFPENEQYLTYKAAYLDNVTRQEEEKYVFSSYRISYDCGTTFGELYKSPVTSIHGPIELQDGTILWVGMHEVMESGVIKAYKLNLDGTSEYVGEISSDGIEGELDGYSMKECFEKKASEAYAFQLPDGKIICHIRVEPLFTLFQTESTDGGKTWTVPHRAAECYYVPAHISRHSSGVLISGGGYRANPYDVRLMFSEDDGKTWDVDHILFKGQSWDLGYPSTVELKDGSLLTVFYAHYPTKDDPAVILAQRWTFEK